MPAYILRAIDPTLWAAVKARAQGDGIPVRAVILKLLALYGQGKLTITAVTASPATRG